MTSSYQAQFYHSAGNETVKCELCPHNCKIKNNNLGICGVRKNIAGKLYSLNFAQISSLGIDPIEKKPLYHFYPEAKVLSLGSWGCNMSCGYCQNWQISQKEPQTEEYYPEDIIALAKKREANFIAYTYSEPTVFYEYMFETAKLAAENGIKNIMVSNGFINQKPLKKLLPYLDAANIDLKAFNDKFYQKHCGAGVEEVKETIKLMAEEIHLELTTLIITNLNDNLEELTKMFKWISKINPDIPLHLSRYHPAYKLDNSATDLELMKKAYNQAKNYLAHVYLGNAMIKGTADTYCSNCKEKLIKRKSYYVKNYLNKDKCSNCGVELYGHFKD